MIQLRRAFSTALAFSMVLTAFSGTAAFASSKMEDAYNNGNGAKKYDGQYTIYSIDYDGDYYNSKSTISIPSKLDSKTVARIGDGDSSVVGSGASGKNISIPNTVTLIADNAFTDASIKRIYMDEGVKEIGERAFAGCSSLESITMANTITKIGVEAFDNCSSLEHVTMPTSLTKIPDSAFSDCDDLESVDLSNVTSIGDGAFSGCGNLDEITIPATVTHIGYDAFDEDVTIKGYVNSTAQKYAKDNDLEFTSLGTTSGSISLSTTSLGVNAGSSATFTVNYPTSGFTASSSNTNVATVSGYNGNTVTIYGVNAGTTIITVSATGYGSASLSVTVGSNYSNNSYVQLDTNSYSFNVGNVYYVLARTNSASAPTCSSSNSGVVSVQYQADRSNRSDLRGNYSHAYLYQIRGTSAGYATITIGGSSLPVTVSTSAFGSAIPDKTTNFGLAKGNNYYEFRMTVNNTSNVPSFTVGNGSVFKTQYVGKSGNVYIYRVWAVGKAGQKTGIYTTLPGDRAVLHCEGVISQG